ncbi:hypothetical protein B0H13DRAFT_2274934 [Mycena leptocephala]|nr:hypothetical protein B0H13DRAFT_2274934 [Mycena leptocephala]
MSVPTVAARRQNRVSATSSSAKIQVGTTERNGAGRSIKKRRTLTAAQVLVKKEEEAQRESERCNNLSRKQLRLEDHFCDLPDAFDNDDPGAYEDNVLHSRAAADISHAGESWGPEEMRRANQDLLKGLQEHHHNLYGRKSELRMREDRTQLQDLSVAEEGLAYNYRLPADAAVQDRRDVLVVDMFDAMHRDLTLIHGDRFVASACVRHGWMPISPYFPKVIITIRALEAFVHALCDIHGLAPRPWLAMQFTVAFDLYLAIRVRVDKRVQAALGRDMPNWRLKNACPPCLYKLEQEPRLEIPFIYTMDGNNSLSRFALREAEEVYADGTTAPGKSKERRDDRVAPGDYYLPREEVDRWAKEGLEDLMKGFEGDVAGVDDEQEGGGCAERWQNMKESVTACAWGMYDETGIFPALCRHGFVLVVVDMAKSGELAKYGFAGTAHLLNVLGEGAGGYDIGCKFGRMVKAHPLLSKLAAETGFKSLAGAFHGHSHNRLSQLDNLTTYVKGVGLEPLEGCETYFSKSNALLDHPPRDSLSPTTGHHDLHEAHGRLRDVPRPLLFLTSTPVLLLCNKYRRALKIKATYQTLRDTMRELRVASRAEFEGWLAKEKAHLRTLSNEPLQETLEMEYYQKLVNLGDIETRVAAVLGVERPFIPAETEAGYAEAAKATRRIETQRRHILEQHAKALDAVQDLEVRLGVAARWVPEDKNWVAAAELVCKRRYQRALDNLERLIISRMFELTKCNMSGTGYKLRKHIAKALQARSKALQAAITRYNEAASALTPPRENLDWVDVVEYAFLADFDLLRDAREDIRQEPWALPSGRAAMDQHYKILRAHEEIERLNVEIRRFVTYMRDEEDFLLRTFTGRDAYEKRGKRDWRSSISRERHLPVARNRDVEMRAPSPLPTDEDEDVGTQLAAGGADDGRDGDVEEEDTDDEGGLTDAFMNILRITHDENKD